MGRLGLLLAVAAVAGCGDDGGRDAGIDAGADAGDGDAGTDAMADAGVDADPMVITGLPDEREACAERNPLRNPYFGDLHVHTSLSFDAAAYDVRTRPADAYQFARGMPIGLPPYDAMGRPTRMLTIDRPLDFAAVTDHSEFLAETSLCNDPTSGGYDTMTCRGYREADVVSGDYGEFTSVLALANPRRPILCRLDPTLCRGELEQIWAEVQDAAENAYDRTSGCEFTTFVAYEWTGTVGGNNLHRNVIFRNRAVLSTPISYVEIPRPQPMLAALDRICNDSDTPCDVLSIPHNSNLGSGLLFVAENADGTPFTEQDAETRARIEPLVEVYQHKGSSECVFGPPDPLASEDELCGFEMVHGVLCTGAPTDPEGCTDLCEGGGGGGFLGGCVAPSDFVRGALRNGLLELERIGANPWQLGFIGSTDTHQALAGGVAESTWPGHLGDSEDDPAERLDPEALLRVRGRTTSPGGLAVLWAEENSRDALFDALRRRETYATSGPRIVLRTFGGWEYPSDLCADADLVQMGYDGGVPMGGVLPARPAGGGAPVLVISALRDAMGAPLQRLQVVKGWVEGGTSHEQVFEVAGDPENGATVDEATCTPMGAGFDSLCTVFTDPDFDPAQPAFYYVRAVENPTCRWSRHVCNATGVDCATIGPEDPLRACCDPSLPGTVQERAWSSPIWYVPPAP